MCLCNFNILIKSREDMGLQEYLYINSQISLKYAYLGYFKSELLSRPIICELSYNILMKSQYRYSGSLHEFTFCTE